MKAFIAILLLAVFTVKSQAQDVPSVKMDDIVRIIDSSKGPLVINFWATWCAPCIHEMPYFEKQVASFKNKNITLILVSLDFAEDYPGKLESFIKKNKYQSPVYWLSETDANEFCPKIDNRWEGGLPATLFVNNSKNYRNFFSVPLKEQEFHRELEKLL